MVFRAGKTEKLELNRVLRSDVASLAGDEAAWGDKRTCADAGPIVDPRRTPKPCRPLRSRCSRVDARLQRNTSRQTSDEALEPKPCRPESNPSSPPCSESKRTPMRPAALPGSRNSETHETTKGSAELEFRIQLPPEESHKLSVPRR